MLEIIGGILTKKATAYAGAGLAGRSAAWALKKIPNNVDWSGLKKYEETDNTTSSQTLACSGNSCEMVDLTKD